MDFWGLFLDSNEVVYKQITPDGSFHVSFVVETFLITNEDTTNILIKGSDMIVSADVNKFVVSECNHFSVLSLATTQLEFIRILDFFKTRDTLPIQTENVPAVSATEGGRYVHIFSFENEVKLLRYLHPSKDSEEKLNPRDKSWKQGVRKLFGLGDKVNICGFFREQHFIALLPRAIYTVTTNLMDKLRLGQVIGREIAPVKNNVFRLCVGKDVEKLKIIWSDLSNRQMSFEEYLHKVESLKDSKDSVILAQRKEIQSLKVEREKLMEEIAELQAQLQKHETERQQASVMNSSFSTEYGFISSGHESDCEHPGSIHSPSLFASSPIQSSPVRTDEESPEPDNDNDSCDSFDLFDNSQPKITDDEVLQLSNMEQALEKQVIEAREELQHPSTKKAKLSFEVGETVMAKENNTWYRAKVIGVGHNKVNVHWHGYSKLFDCKISLKDVKKVEVVQEFKVGDTVEAFEKKFNEWFRGVIVEQTKSEAGDDVCTTEGCVLASARVLSAMDHTKDPCKDFYNFACGAWIREHPIPEDKGSFGTFTKLRDDVTIIVKNVLEAENVADDPDSVKKARLYYSACRNEENIEKLGLTEIQSFLEDLGGWPVLGSKAGGKWSEGNYNLEDLLINAKKGTNHPPLIDFGVSQDDKDPEHYVLYIDQPDVGMPSRDYYFKGRNDSTLMAYQKLLTDIAVAMGADEATAAQDAKDIVDFEIEFANITVPKEERRDPEKLYNKMTLGTLKNNFTGVDWTKLIKSMMGIVGDTSVGDDETVIVIAPAFFDKLPAILSKYNKRTIANYIVALRVVGKTFYLPKVFRDIKLEYSSAVSGTAVAPPRWQSCADSVKSAMSEVVGRLFVMKAFKKEAKTDVLDLVEKLRSSFKEMIGNLDWMAPQTKTTAKDKADAVDPRIGYPELVYNKTALDDKYKEIVITKDDPLKSYLSVLSTSVRERLEKLRKTYDKSEWDMSSATVNAYYNPTTNQITFPAAILQPPFYSHDQPSYLNYGGIGYVIGHEITHGFDDQGRQYDKNGNLKSWWTKDDADKFKVRAQCIIDQYANFTVPGTNGMHLNGITTQGENIADNGGIKESFRAYQKWVAARGSPEPKLPGIDYTPNQLYFLNAAQVWCDNMRDKAKIERIRTDPHSIDMFRVYGPMQNYDEFSKAWNCPAGSYMNKKDKCAVW